MGPDYHAPSLQLPERWHQSATDGLAEDEADVRSWWKVFNDPMLTSLIERAADSNLDVRIAVLRIREARAMRGVAAGELLPTLGAHGSYQRTKMSSNSFMAGGPQPAGRVEMLGNSVTRGVAGSTFGQALAFAAPGAPALTNSFANGLIGLVPMPMDLPQTEELDLHAAGFDSCWEIDIFGGVRRNVESADAALQATVEDYRGTLASLLAEVAATYIEIRTLQVQLDATTKNVRLQKETLSLTEKKLEHGLARELDVRQAETNLATTESQLPRLETALTINIYRMAVLLGQEPAALYDELSVEGPIPLPPDEVLVGVPTDILRQRPDLRAAERRLAAQTARIGVATADLYPRFTLSGTFGFEATDFNHALDARSMTYGFGPSVRWNIFDGLRNLHRIAAREAATEQSFVVYQQTLLYALQEVESTTVAYKREQARRDSLRQATEAAERSVDLVEVLYRDGLTGFENVLVTQRALVNLQNQLAQSKGQVAVNLVSLYKVLGGGWSPDQIAQAEYLEGRSDALTKPVGYFFSGGKTALPWENETAERRHTQVATEDEEGQ